MPAGLWVVLCACQAAPGGGAWVQGRHFTAFGRRGGVLRADGGLPRRQAARREYICLKRMAGIAMSNDDKGSHSVMVTGMGIDLHDISLFGEKVQIFH